MYSKELCPASGRGTELGDMDIREIRDDSETRELVSNVTARYMNRVKHMERSRIHPQIT